MRQSDSDLPGRGQLEHPLQPGNAVFQSEAAEPAELAKKIKDAIQRSHGFASEVMLLTQVDLESAVAANPFREAEADLKSLHLAFLADAPENPDIGALEQARRPSQRFAIQGNVFYLHAPEGVGRFKLFAKIEQSLGVAATARNWRTVGRILDIVREVAAVG